MSCEFKKWKILAVKCQLTQMEMNDPLPKRGHFLHLATKYIGNMNPIWQTQTKFDPSNAKKVNSAADPPCRINGIVTGVSRGDVLGFCKGSPC